ncbi:DNA ligase [Paenibacillus allorhizosphaerae]|uniref:Bifunctional non-homologous end joining protein LigD n=1 Tax=Paenibacillus allorhizosphaerae TaxID=2849866 RepID=A0ABM8VBS5_9BACL|nr:DNA ligase [Paenibacillus allorhizosphaerae]CAG7621835.1 Bifunctional non-homologous end joining protein LigD [Paenibacillus allorhizosphaerae]
MLFKPLNPMLPVWREEPFDDEAYLFEPKWDGARMLLHKQGGRIEAYTRSGMNVTGLFPELQEAAQSIRAHTAILDCEGICLRGDRSVFDDFMHRLRLGRSDKIKQARTSHPAAWIAFDVLLTTGGEHMQEPLLERKRRLDELLEPGPALLKTVCLESKGNALFELTAKQCMEGIVAKRKTSAYKLNMRSPDWLKIKHTQTIDAAIVGYRTNPFQLLIGLQFRTVKNKLVGTVQAGLEAEHREWFFEQIQRDGIRQEGDTFWVEPRLCCRIQYKDRSDTHQLRYTRFVSFLPDKRVEDCVWSYGLQ